MADTLRLYEAALEAIRQGPEAQIAFLHKYGVNAPRVGWESLGASQKPEAYDLEGDFETDARHIYPARSALVKVVAILALEGPEAANKQSQEWS